MCVWILVSTSAALVNTAQCHLEILSLSICDDNEDLEEDVIAESLGSLALLLRSNCGSLTHLKFAGQYESGWLVSVLAELKAGSPLESLDLSDSMVSKGCLSALLEADLPRLRTITFSDTLTDDDEDVTATLATTTEDEGIKTAFEGLQAKFTLIVPEVAD